MNNRNKTIHYGILVSLFCGLFVFAQLDLANKRFVDFDSGWHATIAKNLAYGEGYASSYHEKKYFDSEAAIGPSVIIPLSIVISISGNNYETPYVFAALFNGSLLLLALLLLHKSFDRAENWLLSSVIILSFAFLYEPIWWIKFTADIPVILFCFISAALLNYQHRSLMLLAGLFAGLALLAELYAVFYLLAAIFYFVFIAKDFRSLANFIIGLLSPIIIWQVYKSGAPAGSLSLNEKIAFLKSRSEFGIGYYLDANSTIDTLKNSFSISHQVLVTILKDYGLHYVSYYILVGLNIFAVLYSVVAIRKGHENFKSVFCISLFSLFVWAWYFILCFSLSSKYSLYPLLICTIVLVIFFMANFNKVNAIAYVMLLVFVLMLPASLKTSASDRALGKISSDPYKAAYLQIEGFVNQFEFKLPLMSCGKQTAPWVFEYNSKEVLNFKDCYQVIAQSKKHTERFTLFMDKPLWRVKTDDSAKNELLMSYCEKNNPLQENNYYAVLECSVDVSRFNQGNAKKARSFKAAADQ